MTTRYGKFTARFGMILVFILSFGVLNLTPGMAQDAPVTFTELTAATLPWDAAPSPDGSIIYYTAISGDGLPAVFSIPTTGGEAVILAQGQPLVMPLGIAVSTDGKTVYVTDPWSAGSEGNGIYALAADNSGQAAMMVNGTRGTSPQGITVTSHDGVDQVYFTGIDATNGQPAVYRIASPDTQPTVIASGLPLIAPAGITVAGDGTVYVLDRMAAGNGLGSVFRISDGKVEAIVRGVRTGGQMPGLALTLDEALLLVSSLDKAQGTAQVLVINLATLDTSIINDVIGQNTAAGGLHRAYLKDQYAWADSAGGPAGGKVFGVGKN